MGSVRSRFCVVGGNSKICNVARTVPHVQTDLRDPHSVSTCAAEAIPRKSQHCDRIGRNLQRSVAITSSARCFKENFRVMLGDGCQCCLLSFEPHAAQCRASCLHLVLETNDSTNAHLARPVYMAGRIELVLYPNQRKFARRTWSCTAHWHLKKGGPTWQNSE